MPEGSESLVDESWTGEPNALKNQSWVDQSWESNAPKTQASTRTNQSTMYTEEDPYDHGKNEDELYNIHDWFYSNQPAGYNQVHLCGNRTPWEATGTSWKPSMNSSI